jgi:glycosyltransferase involved in cell wall biosynthesis
LLAYVGFDIACFFWLLVFGWRYRVIVTLTEPPLIGLFGVMMHWLSFGRIKHVARSMDLYTDCMFALGSVSPKNPLGFVLERLNRLELRSANATVALGTCMRDRLLTKGVDRQRISVIGVWNRADQLTPSGVEDNELRASNDLTCKFVVMYSGNVGRSHTFEAICQAMLTLRDESDIVFLFVGGGKRLEDVKRFAKEHQLPNFRVLPYFPREMLNESLAMGDVHLVSLQRNMAGVVVPCKLYGIMGVGRPVLFVGPAESTVAREITEAQAGFAFAVDDAEGLTAAIRKLKLDAQSCRQMGERGRRFFLAHHEREACCQRWEALLEQVVGAEQPRAAVEATPAERAP